MKKAIIIFNGIEKIVDITDDFHTEIRVTNEMAAMAMEESPFLNVPQEHKKTPYIFLPKDIAEEVFAETEIDRQYEIVYERYEKNLIDLIEKNFSVKVNGDCFYNEEYRVSKKDLKNGIVAKYEAEDEPLD